MREDSSRALKSHLGFSNEIHRSQNRFHLLMMISNFPVVLLRYWSSSDFFDRLPRNFAILCEFASSISSASESSSFLFPFSGFRCRQRLFFITLISCCLMQCLSYLIVPSRSNSYLSPRWLVCISFFSIKSEFLVRYHVVILMPFRRSDSATASCVSV